jgi:siroheme synthase-like protein
VAERKLGTLLRAGADVVVVAPRVTEGIRRQQRRGCARWKRAVYAPAYLKGARFVLAATSDPATNRAVARAARRVGAFVAVADDPALCTLFMPAILRRGDLLVAVSTGGRSPGVARMLRDDLARRVGPEYGSLVRLVGSIRARLQEELPDPTERARRLSRLLRAPLAKHLRAGRRSLALKTALRAVQLSPMRRPRRAGAS